MISEFAAPTVNNDLYIRRRAKVLLPAPDGEAAPENFATSAAKNVEALGYSLSPSLVEAMQALSPAQLASVYKELVESLKRLRGAHQEFKPFYPNFPEQVMEMSEVRLYLNAILHYWSGGQYRRPETEKAQRAPLTEATKLTPLDLGSQGDFEDLLAQIVGSNTSLSEQDKEDVAWFVQSYGDAVGPLLPEAVPQKENTAYLAGLLLAHTKRENATAFVGKFCQTATDVLRLAAALSSGDVSLATSTRFRTFTRAERTLLLSVLEAKRSITEDMLRYKPRWIRLGEKLHPGEYAKKYPRTFQAFQVLRNDEPFQTFNGQIEAALAQKNVADAVARLQTRPGELARRLDHLLRLNEVTRDAVAAHFEAVAHEVSTPVLLQVRQHFAYRQGKDDLRVFFPKGSLAKAQGIPNNLPDLPEAVCQSVVTVCEAALRARFGALEPLGTVYVDPELRDFPVPFAMRSASKSLRTLVRGSRLPLPEGDVLRFFVWWKNGKERTDIDLAASFFDADFQLKNTITYYNLKTDGAVHSGDVVDAPDGASEFIDITRETLRASGVRYVVMTLHSYTQQSYVELPECFAGWMARKEAQSGEVYEPRTVQDRLDITADTRIALPLVLDLEENVVVWCDMALKREPRWNNNVAGNLGGIAITLRALVSLNKPNLYDLFRLHAEARGTLVGEGENAQTVFSVARETPFHIEEIAANYMV